MIKRIFFPILYFLLAAMCAAAQDRAKPEVSADTSKFIPRAIPALLSPQLFIPRDRLQGVTPWMSAPIARPTAHVLKIYGFNGHGFGRFTVDHFDKFFANLLVFNDMSVPQLLNSQQMMLGNTISLGKKRRWFFANGILYGRQYGTWGNMIGMGSREGIIFKPSEVLILSFWTQEYQSVYAFSPVVYPVAGENAPYVKLPASPLMISYGAQAYFLAGQFWIGLGATLWTASRSVE